MKQPVCFVIMGFGLKTDYPSGKTYDLDKTYKNIIQPAVVQAGYQCIRADEIQESGLIDRSMYALLVKADLVIADITTYNPNAIYELGIRHGVRPFATIILKEQESKREFDFSHDRIFSYKHLGEDIGADEAKKATEKLLSLITAIKNNPKNDSPLYELIKTARKADYDDTEYHEIIGELARREKSLFAIVEQAREDMKNSKFIDASKLWEKANSIAIDESYYTQQQALSRYKSKFPSEITSLNDALCIIRKLNPDESADPETLGITGAIYKRLYLATNDAVSLDKAIEYYSKGFNLYSNYYTGENYANCLDMKAKLVEKDSEEKIAIKYMAKEVRKKIIKDLENMPASELAQRNDKKWIYATLANCSLYLKYEDKAAEYEKSFFAQNPESWEIETYEATKQQLRDLE